MIDYGERLIEMAKIVKDPSSSAEDVDMMMYYCGIRGDDASLLQTLKRSSPAKAPPQRKS